MKGLSTRVGTVLNGIASGMIPMAIFTPLYAIWPVFAWPVAGAVILALALAWSAYLAVTAHQLLRRSTELPSERNAFDARIARGMTVVSSVQGGLILAAVLVLVLLGQYVWILPVVALIVALHFFPMPAMFERTIDYYLGTGMAIASLTGLALAGMGAQWQVVWAATGVGGGLITALYGLYMVRAARRTLAAYEALTTPD